MISTYKESNEVLYPVEDIVTVSTSDLDELKQMALLNPSRRIRLCAHHSVEDDVHEMIIFHPQGTYVRPHKHMGKDESLHLICGKIDCIIFDNDGNVINVLPIGEYSSGETFFYRIPSDTYHTQIFRNDTIFHEVTKGPFNNKDTVLAKWAPNGKDPILVKSYIDRIKQNIVSIKNY